MGARASESVIALADMHGTDLAWALVDAARTHLNALERNYIFVTLGAGDAFAAVHQLLKLVAAKRVPLQPHLTKLCGTWLSAYVGHEEYDYLRGLIEDFLIPDSIRASAAIRRCTEPPRRFAATLRGDWFASTARQGSRRVRSR